MSAGQVRGKGQTAHPRSFALFFLHVRSLNCLFFPKICSPPIASSGAKPKAEQKILTHEQEAVLNRIKTMSLLDYTGVDVNLHHMLSSI